MLTWLGVAHTSFMYYITSGGGALFVHPPAAPDLYFPSCTSSYIPAYML